MHTHFSRVMLFYLIAFAAGIGHAQANTVAVHVGGTMTSGGGYGGGYTTPILAFSPTPLTINVGDTVTFTNLGGTTAAHNIHADDGSFRCANGCDGDGNGGNGTPASNEWSASVAFTKAGTLKYHCDNHAGMGMVGSIVVNAVTPPPIALGGYLSGNWYNASQGGHGFQLEFTNFVNTVTGKPSMIAIWFVYTPAGSSANDGSGQNWIYAQGDYDTTKTTVTLPAILETGAKFPPNFNSNDTRRISADSSTLWGTLTFTFSDCNNGTASWHSTVAGYNNSNDTPLPITRLTQIAGTSCPQ